MPMRITMLQTRNGEAGVGLLAAGSTYTVSDAFGAQMVGSKFATDTDGVLTPLPTAFPPAVVSALQRLFSSNGGYAIGSLAIDQLPNNTLGDTVTTQQQMAFATIPGGLFGPNSILEVNLTGNLAGNDGKTIGFKVGPASGNMASATAFGGTGGITTQIHAGCKAILWGNGVLGQQRASPNGPINWAAVHAGSPVVLGVDTSLDWNIYVYYQSAVAGGSPTNSFQLRAFWATWIR